MNEPSKPPERAPKQGTEDPSRADVMALGIGCLVFVLLIGAAMFYGFTRDL
jgi:hypothetical protein